MELSNDIRKGVGPWYPIYLTNWSLFCVNCYLNISFAIALWIYMKSPEPASEQPWPTKVAWVMRSIGQPGALVISVAYWALLYDGNLTLVTFWVHAINSIVCCLDVLISCHEVRLAHVIYELAIGAAYMIWSGIHYAGNVGAGPPPTQRYIYSELDWSAGHQGQVGQSRPAAHARAR